MSDMKQDNKKWANYAIAVGVFFGGSYLGQFAPKKFQAIAFLAPILGAVAIGYSQPFFKDKK